MGQLPLPVRPQPAPGGPLPAEDGSRLVAGNTAFALDLVERLREASGNLLVSPYSLSAALVMLAAGAGGDTAAAMGRVLRLQARGGELDAFGRLSAGLAEDLTGGSRLITGQSLWPDVRFSLRPAYVQRLKTSFQAAVTPLDYAGDPQLAAGRINAWVADRTRGRIKEAVFSGDLSADTALVLVTTIWFKGEWERPFDPQDTRPAPFVLETGGTRTVPMMQRTGGYRLGPIPGGRVLEIPYAGERSSMLILLPDRRGGLDALQRQLTPDALARWIGGMEEQMVQVALPRFQMRWRTEDLPTTLTSMGLGAAFAAGADFSGISADPGLRLSRVMHEASLTVDESGSEAAAATVLVPLVTGLSDDPIAVFRVDQPFLLVIRDRPSGSLLFLGRLMDPGQG